jgi:hypothetical protein
LLWACWTAVVDRLLGGPRFPSEVCIGRERIALAVDRADWDELRNELGLGVPRVAERVALLLGAQLLPHGGSKPAVSTPPDGLVPPHLLGLILIICRLEQTARAGERPDHAFGADLIPDALARHPEPAAFGRVDEKEVFRAVCRYTGLPMRSSSQILRVPYFASYRPLRRRLAGRVWEAGPIILSAGLLDDAPPGPAAPHAPAPDRVPPIPVERLPAPPGQLAPKQA